MTMQEDLLRVFETLSPDQQQQVVNYVQTLVHPVGEPGHVFVQSRGLFTMDALDEMEAAIEDGTEEIDWRDWV